jgi:hypothetical protein
MTEHNLLFKISEDIGGLKKDIDNLKYLNIEQSKKIDEVHEKTFNIDSWKNGIIHYVTEEKEKLRVDLMAEIRPLQDDYKKRCAFTSDVKKKGWDIAWDWGKMAVLFIAGYLLTIITKIK